MTAPKPPRDTRCKTGCVAVFYDRANGREVTSDELTIAPCYRARITYTGDDERVPDPRLLRNVSVVSSELAYRTKRCPAYQNFDMHTNTNDLVFVRLEERTLAPQAKKRKR